MGVDIAYIVSHGFAARMVTQTNLLKLLRERGKRVALICPDKNDPNLAMYCRKNDVELYEFDERGGFFSENYMFKRKYFLEDIKNNPALMDKHIHATRYNRSIHPIRKIRPYYYWAIYRMISIFPGIRARFLRNEKKYLKSAKAEALIDKLAPKKLVATYPVNYNEAVLLHYGNRRQGTETWIHLLSWDNITAKGHFPEIAEKYIAWGEIMKQELQECYRVPADRIFTTGVPHFDLHIRIREQPDYKKELANLGLAPEVPYIFFAMSSPRFSPGEIEVVEWLAREVEKRTFGKLQLIIRPHPQNVRGNMADMTWLPRLRQLQSHKNVAVDFPDVVESKLNWSMDDRDLLRLGNLITGSLIVLNSGSTVSIDGLLHHKPIIITSFDGSRAFPYWKSARRLIDYLHLRKLIDGGGISVVRSFEELSDAIFNYLRKPDHLQEERLRTLGNEISMSDRSATESVVAVLA